MTSPVSLMNEHHSTTILDAESLNRLDGLYLFYHKQWWCKRQMFYRFKKCNAFFNGMALVIMAASVVIGSVWKDSFVVVGLTSSATLLKGWNDFKKYSFKMDMCKFAYTTYEKTLIELRNYVRAGMDDSSMSSFLTKMQTLDDTITDFTPSTDDRYFKSYDKHFSPESLAEKTQKPETHPGSSFAPSTCQEEDASQWGEGGEGHPDDRKGVSFHSCYQH